MKTTDHLVIIFEGNTFAIFSSSNKAMIKNYSLLNISLQSLVFSFR